MVSEEISKIPLCGPDCDRRALSGHGDWKMGFREVGTQAVRKSSVEVSLQAAAVEEILKRLGAMKL